MASALPAFRWGFARLGGLVSGTPQSVSVWAQGLGTLMYTIIQNLSIKSDATGIGNKLLVHQRYFHFHAQIVNETVLTEKPFFV